MTIPLDFFRSETSQRLRNEGQVENEARLILKLLDQRDIPVTDEARERIVTCTDLTTLDTWFARAITATSTDELFAD